MTNEANSKTNQNTLSSENLRMLVPSGMFLRMLLCDKCQTGALNAIHAASSARMK